MNENGDNGDKGHEQKEVGLYERLATRTAELLDSGRKTFDEAFKKAREEVASAGDFSREQVEKVSGFVRRDLTAIGANASRTGETIKKACDPQRVTYGVQSVFSRILTGAADLLGDWAEKTEKQLEFRTGEVTSLGTLQCKACEAEMHMKKTGRIPPCPKCHKTVFRRSY